jgi:5-methylcytosine-specific restriction endonuclease McrA
MTSAEYQAWLRTQDQNKHHVDYPHDYNELLAFYKSAEWRDLRDWFKDEVVRHGSLECWGDVTHRTCWGDLNVDHIHPVRFRWSRRLCRGNLQILCERHNEHKGNSDPSIIGLSGRNANSLRLPLRLDLGGERLQELRQAPYDPVNAVHARTTHRLGNPSMRLCFASKAKPRKRCG